MQILIKRLELIKNCISLEDSELIEQQIIKLESIEHDESVGRIIDMLNLYQYARALVAIEEYIDKNTGLAVYEDKEVAALKLELKALELKLQKLTLKKNEYLNSIDDFNVEHNLKLGKVIRRILAVKESILHQQIANKKRFFEAAKKTWEKARTKVEGSKSKVEELEIELDSADPFGDDFEDISKRLETAKEALSQQEELQEELRKQTKQAKEELESDPVNEEYEETIKDRESFEQEYQEAVKEDEESCHLSDEQQKELKKLYRKAIRLCHPDIVEDDLKEQAHNITVELNKARKIHDLDRIKEIFAMLESGDGFNVASDTIFDKEALENKIVSIKDSIASTELDISGIEASDIYEVISEYENLDVYFDNLKEQLEENLEELKLSLKHEEDRCSQSSTIDFEEHEKLYLDPDYLDAKEKYDEEYQSMLDTKEDDEKNDTYWDEVF